MSVAENVSLLRHDIERICAYIGRNPLDIKIVPATKTVPPQIISTLKACGIDEVGENRVQELTEKFTQLDSMKWHFIGALQTNKVKYIIDKVSLIHSLDRASLADEIEKQAARRNLIIDALIEINAGGESAKSGVAFDGIEQLYSYLLTKNHIRIKGFMAVFPQDAADALYESVHKVFLKYNKRNPSLDILSMGMSGDYETAIRHGATLIRPGSIIFGKRV